MASTPNSCAPTVNQDGAIQQIRSDFQAWVVGKLAETGEDGNKTAKAYADFIIDELISSLNEIMKKSETVRGLADRSLALELDEHQYTITVEAIKYYGTKTMVEVLHGLAVALLSGGLYEEDKAELDETFTTVKSEMDAMCDNFGLCLYNEQRMTNGEFITTIVDERRRAPYGSSWSAALNAGSKVIRMPDDYTAALLKSDGYFPPSAHDLDLYVLFVQHFNQAIQTALKFAPLSQDNETIGEESEEEGQEMEDQDDYFGQWDQTGSDEGCDEKKSDGGDDVVVIPNLNQPQPDNGENEYEPVGPETRLKGTIEVPAEVGAVEGAVFRTDSCTTTTTAGPGTDGSEPAKADAPVSPNNDEDASVPPTSSDAEPPASSAGWLASVLSGFVRARE